jgi:hypothetical protein
MMQRRRRRVGEAAERCVRDKDVVEGKSAASVWGGRHVRTCTAVADSRLLRSRHERLERDGLGP